MIFQSSRAFRQNLLLLFSLLSSIQSRRYLNVRFLHVESALRALYERMTVNFQEESKQEKLQCSVRKNVYSINVSPALNLQNLVRHCFHSFISHIVTLVRLPPAAGRYEYTYVF